MVHYSLAVKKRQSVAPVVSFWVLAMMDVSTTKTQLSFQGRSRTSSFHLQLSQCLGIRDCHIVICSLQQILSNHGQCRW